MRLWKWGSCFCLSYPRVCVAPPVTEPWSAPSEQWTSHALTFVYKALSELWTSISGFCKKTMHETFIFLALNLCTNKWILFFLLFCFCISFIQMSSVNTFYLSQHSYLFPPSFSLPLPLVEIISPRHVCNRTISTLKVKVNAWYWCTCVCVHCLTVTGHTLFSGWRTPTSSWWWRRPTASATRLRTPSPLQQEKSHISFRHKM